MDCHHLAKFGGHRYCSNRYVFSLSRDQPNYVIKGSCEYSDGSSQR